MAGGRDGQVGVSGEWLFFSRDYERDATRPVASVQHLWYLCGSAQTSPRASAVHSTEA